ncbi:MAG: phospholipase [Burkholderiaceae bacterium]|nr:phospholipase [Burkholderiaceae bacterium]
MSSLQNTLGPLQQSAAFELAFRIKQPQPAQAKACVILLHGVGGSETNLADLAAGIGPDALVALPRGPLEFAPGQFGWFRVAFTANGPSIMENEAEQSRLTLIRFVEQLQSAYGIAPQHTAIAGFSQGGILSASVALSAPEHIAAFGVLSGRILPELQPHLADKQRLAALRGFIGHGEYDTKLPVTWAQRSDQLLTELGVEHLTRLYPIDHGISPAMQADFLEWLQKRG